MNKNTSKEIISILKNKIPNPVCELNFTNNFELICAVVLSAQTTDKRVNEVTPKLFSKYPTPYLLSIADINEVKDIISSIGLATNKSKNIIALSKVIHEKYNDEVPSDMNELLKLPGVGRKTASVVQAVGFKIPAMPVDTHLHRMAIRLGYAPQKSDVLDAERLYKKYIPINDWIDAHHLLLLFGRYYCTAFKPKCEQCELINYCKYKK